LFLQCIFALKSLSPLKVLKWPEEVECDALGQDYVVDTAQLPTSAFATRQRCEVLLHHAEASLQRLIVLVSFV
jgi:hypothetical protein